MSYGSNGSVIGPDNVPTSSAAPGVWSLGEIAEAVRDDIWPIALGPSWEAIATVTNAGSQASISFTSIPTTYMDLKIVYIGGASSDSYNVFTFNGDTSGSAYNNAVLLGYNSVRDGAGGSLWFSSAGSEWFPMQQWPRATGTSVFANGEIHLPGYSQTAQFKPGFFIGSNRDTTSYTGAQSEGGPMAGWYCGEQTAAMTQIDMDRYAGQWDNFTCTLFGLSA